jgi:hypothetical protein
LRPAWLWLARLGGVDTRHVDFIRLDDAGDSLSPSHSPSLASWDVFRQAHKAIWLGTIEATDGRDAIEKVASERNLPANKLIATRR